MYLQFVCKEVNICGFNQNWEILLLAILALHSSHIKRRKKNQSERETGETKKKKSEAREIIGTDKTSGLECNQKKNDRWITTTPSGVEGVTSLGFFRHEFSNITLGKSEPGYTQEIMLYEGNKFVLIATNALFNQCADTVMSSSQVKKKINRNTVSIWLR